MAYDGGTTNCGGVGAVTEQQLSEPCRWRGVPGPAATRSNMTASISVI